MFLGHLFAGYLPILWLLTGLPLPLLWFVWSLVEGSTDIPLRARPATFTCSQHCRQLQVCACSRKRFLGWKVGTALISRAELGLTVCIPLLNTPCISVINAAISQPENLPEFTWPFPQPILGFSQSLQHSQNYTCYTNMFTSSVSYALAELLTTSPSSAFEACSVFGIWDIWFPSTPPIPHRTGFCLKN